METMVKYNINIDLLKSSYLEKNVELIAVKLSVFKEFTKKSYFSDIYMDFSVINSKENMVYIIGNSVEIYFDKGDIYKSFVKIDNLNNFYIEKDYFLLPELPPDLIFKDIFAYSKSSIYICQRDSEGKINIISVNKKRIFRLRDIISFSLLNPIEAFPINSGSLLKVSFLKEEYKSDIAKNTKKNKKKELKTKIISSKGKISDKSKSLKISNLLVENKEISERSLNTSELKKGVVKKKELSLEIRALLYNNAKDWWKLFLKYYKKGLKNEASVCFVNALWVDRSILLKLKQKSEKEKKIIFDCPDLYLLFKESFDEQELLNKDMNIKLIWLLSIIRSSSRYDYFWAFQKREYIQMTLNENGIRIGIEIPEFVKELKSKELNDYLINISGNSNKIDKHTLTITLYELLEDIEKTSKIDKDILFKQESIEEELNNKERIRKYRKMFSLNNFYIDRNNPFFFDYNVLPEEELLLNILVNKKGYGMDRFLSYFNYNARKAYKFAWHRVETVDIISNKNISDLKIPFFVYKLFFEGFAKDEYFFDSFITWDYNVNKLNRILKTYVELSISNEDIKIEYYLDFMELLIKNIESDYYWKYIDIINFQVRYSFNIIPKSKKNELRLLKIIKNIMKKFKKIKEYPDFTIAISIIKFKLDIGTPVNTIYNEIKRIGIKMFSSELKLSIVDIRDIIMQILSILQYLSYEEKVGIIFDIIQYLKKYDAHGLLYLKGQIYYNLIKFLETIKVTPETFMRSYERSEKWNIKMTMEKDLKKLRSSEFILNL